MKKSKGALGLRVKLMCVEYNLEAAMDALEDAMKRAKEIGATDQLAVAAKALRAIANTRDSDARSKGIAKATLEKMKVAP